METNTPLDFEEVKMLINSFLKHEYADDKTIKEAKRLFKDLVPGNYTLNVKFIENTNTMHFEILFDNPEDHIEFVMRNF